MTAYKQPCATGQTDSELYAMPGRVGMLFWMSGCVVTGYGGWHPPGMGGHVVHPSRKAEQ